MRATDRDPGAAAVRSLAPDARARGRLGEAARETIRAGQGAASRTVELIRNVLAASADK